MRDGLEIFLLATTFLLNEFGIFSPKIFLIYESYVILFFMYWQEPILQIYIKKDKIAPTEFNHPNTHQNTLSSYFLYSFEINTKECNESSGDSG